MLEKFNLNLWLVVVAIVVCLSFSQSAVLQRDKVRVADEKTPWELIEALYGTSGLRSFNGTWISDEEFYYVTSDEAIRKYNAATKTDTLFFSSDFLKKYTGASFTLSPDNTKILIRHNLTQKFRHSYVAQYDVYDIESDSSIPVHEGEKLQYCGWSPSKNRLAYVYLNNVYIHFSENNEIKITVDGVDGIIYNGVPDWVYEEEVLSSGSAIWWSADGLKLAVGFFNDTEVETYRYFLYGDGETEYYQYPHEENLKYPKAGTKNPSVILKVYDLTTDDPTMQKVNAPIDIVGDDHILQNVVWSNNSYLLITWLNRRQNLASIQSCSHLGECAEVTKLSEPNGWISLSTPKCLTSGKSCIFAHYIDDWYQMWNLNLETGVNSWKSRGNFTVKTIYGYDEANNKIYYQATLEENPNVYHVFSNDDCLSCNQLDVEGEACVSARATFSKSFSYYTLTCVGPNPYYTRIFEASSNTLVSEWEPNTDYRAKIQNKQRPTYKIFNVTLGDGSIGYAKLALPSNFNESKKYPLIVVVYQGPDTTRVLNEFTVSYEAFLTTSRDTIYGYIDGRGTGNKGKNILFSVNNDLGDHEVEDQLLVTKWMQENLPYVDRDRCGIWGWSYGGYMTARTIQHDNDKIFQCGVSVAPVTSWLYYDTIYTERFMGLPTETDNLKKYNESSVFGNLDNFHTHDYLLIHGSGDDNVHYQNSLVFAKLLQKEDIQFQEQTYTDENHGIGNFLPHLYNTIDHFWINCLGLPVNETVEY